MKAAVANCPLKPTEEEEVYEISVNAAIVFFYSIHQNYGAFHDFYHKFLCQTLQQIGEGMLPHLIVKI